jgi:hypothetical protein
MWKRIIKRAILPGVLLCCLGLSLLAAAQEDAPPEQPGVLPGTLLSGTLDDATPRQVYVFDGSRGEVIRFRLATTAGNLDPVLTVFDETGRVIFTRDDLQGSLDIDTTVTIPQTTRYFVVVGRFGYGRGSTQGSYTLALERVGVVSDQGTNLIYGVPVINTISDTQPQVYYTFQAEAGDRVDIRMTRSSGTLDPYLQVVDSGRFVIAENDDDAGDRTRNARLPGLLIRESGTYIVIATRYGQASGDSAGTFVLTINPSENTGSLSAGSLAPVPILANAPVEDVLNDDTFERVYTFNASRDDIISITLNRTGGSLDTRLTLANAALQPVLVDDDGGGGSNARIERYRIPADGVYYIIAGRADGEQGRGRGSYRLEYRREGRAFDGVNPGIPRLEYGAALTDSITADDPDSLFAFWGSAGDVITIAMNRVDGDLDSFLELLDSRQQRITSDDDGGGGQNARLDRYRLPRTDLYYIRASRFGAGAAAGTTGTYTLTLLPAAP